MHQPLETYLQRVKVRLKSLPAHEQEQHLREIEQHLQRLLADGRAMGLTEEEAVKTALRQFGHPSHVGRAIEQARFGTKTGVVKGVFTGALLGVSLIALVMMGLALTGEKLRWSGLGSWTQYLVTIALSGGVASCVGRRFTRRYLTRPARRLPIFTWASQSLTVAARFLGVGALRGAVGGTVFGALNAILMLRDPNSYVPATLAREIEIDLVILTLVSGIDGALLIGFGSAVLGLVLGARDRRTGERQPT